MLNKEIDHVDKQILQRIIENPGISATDAGRPFFNQISENMIYYRIRRLTYKGFVRTEKISGAKKCYPTEATANAG